MKQVDLQRCWTAAEKHSSGHPWPLQPWISELQETQANGGPLSDPFPEACQSPWLLSRAPAAPQVGTFHEPAAASLELVAAPAALDQTLHVCHQDADLADLAEQFKSYDLLGEEAEQVVAVHRIFVALNLDHQGDTLAYEYQLEGLLQLAASEQIEPA
nr:hypothetical protein Iba_chr14bCG18080 [Ipomoea batatas]